MTQAITLKLTEPTIKKMTNHYQKALVKAPPYSIFSAKLPGVTITAYQSGKVLFQGNHAEQEASQWGDVAEKKGPQKAQEKTTNQTTLPANFSNWPVIGSDEVGNGSYLGPVVVCATYVTPEQMPLLKELGVKDSKMLTDKLIRQIAEEIKLVVPYQELIVTPEKYNHIQPDYNVNRMKVALHNQAISLLLKKIHPTTPQGILIDQFTTEKNYRKYLALEKKAVTSPLYFQTKGEQYHLAVAAASIICRATFLNELDRASQELGLVVPSGAGPKSDQVAARILKKGGLALLTRHAKLHFANTEKAKKIAYR